MPLPYRLLLFALSVALLFVVGCDALAAPDDPGDDPGPPDPPAQTFDDTPVALQTALLGTGSTRFTLFNTGFQGGMVGGSGDSAFAYAGRNGLYEGQLLIGSSRTQVSGRPYSVQAAVNEPNWTEGSALTPLDARGDFDEGFRTRFTDAGAGNPAPIGLTVTQWSYAGPIADGAVVLVYDVRNDGPARDSLYVGLFADFDLADLASNRAGYDAAARTVYTYDPSGANPVYYGLAALSDPVSGWTATLGGGADLTDPELYAALTTPGTVPSEPLDARSILGVGPFRLASGATRRVAFAYVAGLSLSDLLDHAAAARTAAASIPLLPQSPGLP